MKDRHLVEAYAPLVAHRPKRILEIGTYTGGSSILLHRLFEPDKLVCVDARPDMPQSEEYVKAHVPDGSMKLYPDIAQADRQKLPDIIRREFGDEPIDLIIDDASHLYEWSKACFEICFPFLKAGGLYVLEDWGWSHWIGEYQQPDHYWAKETALSNLLFEMVMISSSRPDIIHRIGISTAPASTVAALTKGSADLRAGFSVADSYVSRGRALGLL
jgi:predicted O-methyltransferase YrrM